MDSCASILSGSKQEVVISVATDNTKLYVDSSYIATGKNFNTILKKDLKNKQLRFEAEGCKPKYNVLIQDHKSNYHILSWIPFMVLYYPPMFDNAANTWCYEDLYDFGPLKKYTYADSNIKKLFVNNVSFELNKSNYTFHSYPYNYYLDRSDPTEITNLDSMGIASTYFDEELDNVLKKLNYVDTVNKVFIDNVNTYGLEAKVVKLTYKGVMRSYTGVGGPDGISSFLEVDISTLWTLKNSYGDTLRQDTIRSTSGQYSSSYFKGVEQNKKSIDDALESSMLDFIDTLKTNKLIPVESPTVTFSEQIKISKPTKSPADVEQAMKASVSIKNKDSHGSGFLISNDGYIVTNHHVVKRKVDYTVIMNDGTEHKAKVIRSNKSIDLALLKIEGNFEFAYSLPEAQNFSVGDEVLAIGTPKSIQLGQSVSKGIVSGTRKNKGLNYLQTDIGINFGNSGGPIVTKSAELAGVVQSKIVGWGAEGLSFSIPSYDVMKNLHLTY
ncbi:MAG: trypsin-like peptidase domain-containing protein [Ignavibacteria bacterium]|nr:trypsin-like peptidase domain-containing protein [Ignavibacteria bacterium]